MTRPQRPSLASADDLTQATDIDLNLALSGLIEQRYRSPIVRPSTAADVAALIDQSFPQAGESLEHLVAQISNATERYPRRNTHPGFFGWVAPSGLPSDPLAHAMVSVLNENVGTYQASPVGTTIEKTVIRWLADLISFPEQSEGVLLSGGSMANMSGIASALAKRFGPGYREQGLAAFSQDSKPIIICSQAAHFSIRRAAVMLGIGTDNIIAIDTDPEFRMRVDKLEQSPQTAAKYHLRGRFSRHHPYRRHRPARADRRSLCQTRCLAACGCSLRWRRPHVCGVATTLSWNRESGFGGDGFTQVVFPVAGWQFTALP